MRIPFFPDTIEILQNRTLDEVIERCKNIAITRALKSGAKTGTVKVVEVENLPVQVLKILLFMKLLNATYDYPY